MGSLTKRQIISPRKSFLGIIIVIGLLLVSIEMVHNDTVRKYDIVWKLDIGM